MWQYGALPLGARVIQSAALGGSAITPQAGTAKADRSVLLTTSAVTCSAGTAVATMARALVAIDSPLFSPLQYMQSTPGNMGSTQTEDTRALFTQAITSSDGTVAPTYSRALTTSASTCSAGNLGVGNIPTQIALGPISTGSGTLVASGFNVTVDLNAGEVEMVAAVGSVGTAASLSGTASTTALNSFAAVLNTPTDTLLGIQSTLGMGTIAANQDVEDTFIASGIGLAFADHQMALTGLEITGLQDTVTDTEDITLELLGEASLAVAGDFGFSTEFELTGAEFLGEQYYVGAPGYAELAGAESIVSAGELRGFQGEDRDFPLTTQLITATSDAALPYTTIIPLFNGDLKIVSEQYLYNVDQALEGIQIEVGQGRTGPESQHKGAGKAKKDKKRKKVTIDGQTFEVDEDELRDMVKVIEEVATAKAKEEAEALLLAAKADKSVEKIRLKAPKVTGDEELKDKLADIYTQAAIDAQVALEVSRNRQLDEEEAIVLLLVN